jgi:hypothetical protein
MEGLARLQLVGDQWAGPEGAACWEEKTDAKKSNTAGGGSDESCAPPYPTIRGSFPKALRKAGSEASLVSFPGLVFSVVP